MVSVQGAFVKECRLPFEQMQRSIETALTTPEGRDLKGMMPRQIVLTCEQPCRQQFDLPKSFYSSAEVLH